MTHKSTTDNFPDDEFETHGTDESWSSASANEEPAHSMASLDKPLRKHSALRSIEERRERERLRRELDDLDFESGPRIEAD